MRRFKSTRYTEKKAGKIALIFLACLLAFLLGMFCVTPFFSLFSH